MGSIISVSSHFELEFLRKQGKKGKKTIVKNISFIKNENKK